MKLARDLVGALGIVLVVLALLAAKQEDAALASYSELMCKSHRDCNVSCRMLLHFKCTKEEPLCKNTPICTYCVCDFVFQENQNPYQATDCNCIKPGMP